MFIFIMLRNHFFYINTVKYPPQAGGILQKENYFFFFPPFLTAFFAFFAFAIFFKN